MSDVDLDLAWAAGFLDADGCFSLCRNSHRQRALPATTPHYHRATIRCSQVGVREPVDKLARVLGGRVTERKGRLFSWSTESIERVAEIIERLLPHLIRKRPEAEALLAYCRGPGRPQPRQHKISPEQWREREAFVERIATIREARR